MNYLAFLDTQLYLMITIAFIGLLAGIVKGISGFGSSLVALPLLVFALGNSDIK